MRHAAHTSQATLIGTIAILLWGALALLTALTEARIPPFQLMSMTFGIAFLLMCARWWLRGESGLTHLRQPGLAWLLGVGGYFGYHFCYFEAMRRAPAVEVSLLAYLWPLLIVVFSALLPGHRLRFWHLFGAVFALSGCWVLLRGGGDAAAASYPAPLAGYLLALACAFIWSGYSVASRLVSHVSTDAAGWFCGVTAVLALLMHLLLEPTVWPVTAGHWLGVAGLGLGPVGLAFFAWDHAVKHGNLPLLGVLAYAAPLVSTILLVLAGRAVPDASLWLACALIVGGSLLASLAGAGTGESGSARVLDN